MYILYKFLDSEGSVLYVGKTTGKLSTRLANHSHLDSSCYLKRTSVEYVKLSSACDLDIYELYYINKYKPPYNTASKHRGAMTISLPELEWKVYSTDVEKGARVTPELSDQTRPDPTQPATVSVFNFKTDITLSDTYPLIRLVRAEQAADFLKISERKFNSSTSIRMNSFKRIRLIYHKGLEACVSEDELRRYMQVLSELYTNSYTEQTFQELPWITTNDYMYNPLKDYVALKTGISRAKATYIVESINNGTACTVEQVNDRYCLEGSCFKQLFLLALLPASVKKVMDAHKVARESKTVKRAYIKQVADEYKDKIPKKLYDALYAYIVEITD